MMTLQTVKQQVSRFSLEELHELSAWLQILIEESEVAPIPTKEGREIVDERQKGPITYRLQYIRCGRPTCKCAEGGQGHGPYWYAYWWQGGRTRSKYIGKQLKGAK